MADLTTYPGLQEAILEWTGRINDPNDPVVPRLPDFIRLGETRLGNDLRSQEQLQSAEALLNEPRETVPDDFVAVYSLGLIQDTTNFSNLRYVDPREMQNTLRPVNGSAPAVYTIVGRQLWFSRFKEWSVETSGDGPTMQLIYWARPRPLSDQLPSNIILETYPNAYLYASLVELGAFTGDDNLPVWKSAYDEIVEEVNGRAEQGLYDTPYTAAPTGIA